MDKAPRVCLNALNRTIVACQRCPRLREHCAGVARTKRRAYLDWEYWGKPVPSFGDENARLLIVGLAPGAHGANRTGRMFTGDSSGDFLYRALYETGFATQPTSRHRDDGLELPDAYITASAHCAPPDNKPTKEELDACRPYLHSELKMLRNVKVVVVLGRIGMEAYLRVLQEQGRIDSRAQFAFGHNVLHSMGDGFPLLLCSYHPSRQNTSTGRLTADMLRAVFDRARRLISGEAAA